MPEPGPTLIYFGYRIGTISMGLIKSRSVCAAMWLLITSACCGWAVLPERLPVARLKRILEPHSQGGGRDGGEGGGRQQ